MDDLANYLKKEEEKQAQFQEEFDNRLKSPEWIIKYGYNWIDKYKKCKNINNKKLILERNYIQKRLAFEKKELMKLIEIN